MINLIKSEKIQDFRKYLAILLSFFVFSSATAIFYSWLIIRPFQDLIYYDIKNVPEMDVALVFGGGMINNDLQSQNQSDRVKTGIDLYKKGKIKKIMLTGDDGSKKANEIDAMKLQAILSGIPQYDILYDPHGYRTYLSCKRAAEVYKLKKAIVISQDFHLPRIIFLCKKAGIETIGFSADYQGYEFSIYDFTRESLARVKAVIEVFSNKLFSNKK